MIRTDKETDIVYGCWSAREPKAVFLLVHGLGAHSGRWNFLADFFLQHSISSYAIELKGFGETKGLKGHIDSFNTYLRDICALRDIIGKENRGRKIFLIGESVGAVISFLLAAAKPHLLDGLICISPAFTSRLKVSSLEYAKIFFFLACNSKKQFNMPFTAEMCTRDEGYQKVMNEDVREHRLASARLIFEIIAAQLKSRTLKTKITMPVLFALSGKDRLADPQASKMIFKGLEIKDKTLIEYPEMYHALPIDLGRERVFEDILKWVEKRI